MTPEAIATTVLIGLLATLLTLNYFKPWGRSCTKK